MVGGNVGISQLSSVELFPPSDTCSIPDLPQPRTLHSLSLLSGGRLVVCGGYDGISVLDSCISWVAGNTTWTPFHTMRCLNYIFHTNQNLNPQHSEVLSHSVDAALSPQLHRPAWRLGERNEAHCRDRARWLQAKHRKIFVLQEEKPLSCVTVEIVPVGFLTGKAL